MSADIIRRWFLDPQTRMAPHLTYAQVRGRWPGDTGTNWGLIEMKDLLTISSMPSGSSSAPVRSTRRSEEGFRAWLRDYLEWLQDKRTGRRRARDNRNNHGTCYDLQTASIAAFLLAMPNCSSGPS